MSDNIPTPSPLPSPPINPHSLSERINISTRSSHTQLNRLILTRLPLALPPYTSNPSVYVLGLLHIAPIYSTFESLWASILISPQLPTSLSTLTLPHDACDPEQPILDSRSIPLVPNPHIAHSSPTPLVHTPKICTRTHSLLSHLRLPGLLRAGRLRADIRVLTSTPDHKIEAQLQDAAQAGALAEFLAHTKAAVEANPHVLLAYAWVLYMALFSGGRYLRAALNEAGGLGSSFWEQTPSSTQASSTNPPSPSPIPPRISSRPPARSRQFHSEPGPHTDAEPIIPTTPLKLTPGLSFFSFIGTQDGTDIKNEFKSRIAEAEILLTAGEKEDIIAEAQHIFTYMIALVNQLDAVVGSSESDLDLSSRGVRRPLSSSRDSVSVAKERLDKDQKIVPEAVEGVARELLQVRQNSFLQAVRTPLVKIVEFKGRLASFDSVVRRFSRTPTGQQVSFGPDAKNGSGNGEMVVGVRERRGRDVETLVLRVVVVCVVVGLGYLYVC